jgi:hypothetical protein
MDIVLFQSINRPILTIIKNEVQRIIVKKQPIIILNY